MEASSFFASGEVSVRMHRPVCLTEPSVLYARPVRVRVYNHRGRRGRLSCRGMGGPWGARGKKKKRAPCRRTQCETRIRRGVDRLWIPNCACPRYESAGSRPLECVVWRAEWLVRASCFAYALITTKPAGPYGTEKAAVASTVPGPVPDLGRARSRTYQLRRF